MCGRGMRNGEPGGGEIRKRIHPLRRRLISIARDAVRGVCYYGICVTSMADIDIDAIKKQKKAERKNQCAYNFYLVIEVPDHVYVLG